MALTHDSSKLTVATDNGNISKLHTLCIYSNSNMMSLQSKSSDWTGQHSFYVVYSQKLLRILSRVVQRFSTVPFCPMCNWWQSILILVSSNLFTMWFPIPVAMWIGAEVYLPCSHYWHCSLLPDILGIYVHTTPKCSTLIWVINLVAVVVPQIANCVLLYWTQLERRVIDGMGLVKATPV